MITIYLMGGLGNQLFQIFTTIAYSLKFKIQFKFEYSEKLNIGIERPTYWNNFLKRLKVFTTNEKLTFPIIKEKFFHYHEIPYINKNFKLYGYYQSYKYFIEYYDNICKLIDLKNIKLDIKNKYQKYFNNKNLVSLHFRLGDYKFKQDYHPIMKLEYYIDSINFIINKTNITNLTILYFCEEVDNNIVDNNIIKLNNIFNDVKFLKVSDDIIDWEQMLIMSNCEHNIIANSTFSWWGAYFNDNENKIVCYPNEWFGKKVMQRNMSDLFPLEWNKIKLNNLNN